MRSSHSPRPKTRAKQPLFAKPVAFNPAIVPGSLCGALCISTIVGGVLLCPGSVSAQTSAGAGGAAQSVNGPSVAIMQPSYADLLHGHVSVLIGVRTQKYAAKTVEMFVDGKSATGGPIDLDNSASTGFDWDTTIFVDGPHRLTVRVTDSQGFIGQSEVQVYINNGNKRDDQAPTLSWLNVKDGDVMKGQVHIDLKASDDFGVKYIFVSINPAATPLQKPALHQYFLNRPPYEVVFDTTAVPDGLYVLDALAWDSLENQGKAPQRLIGVLNNGLNPNMVATLDSMKSTRGTGPGQVVGADSVQALATNDDSAPTDAAPAQAAPAAATGSQGSASRTGSLPATFGPALGAAGSMAAPVSGRSANEGPRLAEREIEQPMSQAADRADAGPAVPAADSLSFVPRSLSGALSNPTQSGAGAAGVSAPQLHQPRFTSSPADLAARRLPSAARGTSAATRHVAAPQTTTHGVSPAAAVGVPATSARTAAEPTKYAMLGESSAPARGAVPTVQSGFNAPPLMTGLGDDHVLDRRFTPEDAAVSVVTGAPVAALITTKSGPSPVTEFAPGAGAGRTTAPRLAARPAPWAPRAHSRPADTGSSSRVLSALHNYNPLAQARIAAAPRPIAGHSNLLRLGAPPRNLAARILPVAFGARSFAADAQTPQLDAAAQSVTSPYQSRIAPAAAAAVPRATNAPSRTTAFAALPHAVSPARRNHAAITIARANPALPTSYQTTRDESLAATAARLGVSPEMLASVNKLPVSAVLTRGTTVLVPRTLTVSYLGKEVKSDVPALMVGSTSTTAFRFLFEAQGGTVQWDGAHHRVVAQNGDQQVVLQIGSRAATVNDQKVMMDLAAYLLSGRTMVPVRLFEKALHAQVEWEPTTGRMLVSIHNSPKVG